MENLHVLVYQYIKKNDEIQLTGYFRSGNYEVEVTKMNIARLIFPTPNHAIAAVPIHNNSTPDHGGTEGKSEAEKTNKKNKR